MVSCRKPFALFLVLVLVAVSISSFPISVRADVADGDESIAAADAPQSGDLPEDELSGEESDGHEITPLVLSNSASGPESGLDSTESGDAPKNGGGMLEDKDDAPESGGGASKDENKTGSPESGAENGKDGDSTHDDTGIDGSVEKEGGIETNEPSEDEGGDETNKPAEDSEENKGEEENAAAVATPASTNPFTATLFGMFDNNNIKDIIAKAELYKSDGTAPLDSECTIDIDEPFLLKLGSISLDPPDLRAIKEAGQAGKNRYDINLADAGIEVYGPPGSGVSSLDIMAGGDRLGWLKVDAEGNCWFEFDWENSAIFNDDIDASFDVKFSMEIMCVLNKDNAEENDGEITLDIAAHNCE